MDNNSEKIKNYIYFDSENYISLGLLRQVGWALLLISSFSLACAISSKALPWSSITLALNVVYLIGLCVFRVVCNKVNSFQLRFLINGIGGSFLSLYFLSLAFSIMLLLNGSCITFVIIFLCYLFLISVSTALIVVLVKKNKFAKKKNSKKNKIRTWSMIGAIAGVSFAGLLHRSIGDHIGLEIAVFCCSMVSFLAIAGGVINLLKYYYCQRHGIISDRNGNQTSMLLIPREQSTKKRIGALVPYMLALLWNVMIALGTLKTI